MESYTGAEWEKLWSAYYPSISQWPIYYPSRSKIEQAFRIVGKLLEKKIVKELNVEQFIELVNEISTII